LARTGQEVRGDRCCPDRTIRQRARADAGRVGAGRIGAGRRFTCGGSVPRRGFAGRCGCDRSHGGRSPTGLDAVDWARRAVELGAGEILLTSIDQDGMQTGYDLELTRRVSEAVSVPVIASGGAGTPQHFADVLLQGGASAALAASLFHFGALTIPGLKDFLAGAQVPVRR